MRTHTCLSTLNAQTHTHADCKQTHMCSCSSCDNKLYLQEHDKVSRQKKRTEKEERECIYSHLYQPIKLFLIFILCLFYFRWLWSSLVVHVHESKDAQKCFLRLIRREAAVSVRFCDLWFQISSFMSLQIGANHSVWFKYNKHVVRVCKRSCLGLK